MFSCLPLLSGTSLLYAILSDWTEVRCLGEKKSNKTEEKTPTKTRKLQTDKAQTPDFWPVQKSRAK